MRVRQERSLAKVMVLGMLTAIPATAAGAPFRRHRLSPACTAGRPIRCGGMADRDWGGVWAVTQVCPWSSLGYGIANWLQGGIAAAHGGELKGDQPLPT